MRLPAILRSAAFVMLASPAMAQEGFTLTSSVLVDGGALPADLKCARDGGDGVSPPLEWTKGPDGTVGYAVTMHHYPRGTVADVDTPSHYWLLWNVPATLQMITRGNPTSIGYEGADKDMRRTGYTAPCSPPGGLHEYTITVFALSGPLADLPTHDEGTVDWERMTTAMDELVLASSALTYSN